MQIDGNVYAFWDFMAEQSYRTDLDCIKEGNPEALEKENKKNLYLFGCNDAAREFFRIFKDSFHFVGVFDNSSVRWGSEFYGLKVFSPKDVIPNLKEDRDVIVISMRLSTDVVARQILDMGFHNIFSLAVIISQSEPYHEWVKKSEDFNKAELSDIVMLESTNDFDGNCGALYEYLKKRGSKHKFVWVLKNPENKKKLKYPEDEALCPKESYEDLLKFVEVRARARWQLWDNTPILKARDDQINVFLQHFGMGYKMINKYYRCPDYVDYVLSPNEFVRKMEQDAICYPKTADFIYGELPRNDVLHSDEWRELEKVTNRRFNKVVLWAPTMKESGTVSRKDSDIDYPYGISLLYKREDMEELNDFLKEFDILLILKPHPKQKLNYSDGDFDNIIYLTGDRAKSIHSYKLLTQIDAMITDYSSIVFDYILLDRPIAWVLEDRDHYKIEYLMDDPEEYMPGEKIYVMDDLKRFLKDVHDGEDPFGELRREICKRCNPPFEGKGCEKTVEALGL